MQPDLRRISMYMALPELPTSTVALVTMLLGLIGDESKSTLDLTQLKNTSNHFTIKRALKDQLFKNTFLLGCKRFKMKIQFQYYF